MPTPGPEVSRSIPPRSVVDDLFQAPGGEPLTLEQASEMVRNADYVLLGEGHSSSCDHTVQRILVQAMASGPNPPVVGFEMVAEDQQPVLDEFNRGELSLEELPVRLDWSANWGYPFEFYAPVFDAARQAGLPVVALNLPFRLARKAGDGVEALTEEERAFLPSVIVDPPKDQEAMLMETLAMHMTNGTESPASERVRRFFLIQSIWDSKMAEMAKAARERYHRPVAVIVGSGHVEFGWGVPHRLKRFDPGASVLLVVPWRGPDSDFMVPQKEKGDLFFFCPPSHRSRLGMTLEERDDGAEVVGVEPDSRADKAGLRQGDLVLGANGVRIQALSDLHVAGSKAHKEGQPLVFTVRRGDETLDIDFGLLGQGQ